VLPERLERFFIRQDHGYRVSKDIREMCIFSTHNLIKDPPFSQLDLIACRNLLIYLESDLQRYVAELFHYALHQGGYLFLGPSESVVGPPELFRTIDRKHRIFQRGDTIAARPFEVAPVLRSGRTGARSGAERVAPAGPRSRQEELVAALERLLLDQYAPAWVVVNAQAKALYFSPRVGRYLEPAPGAPSNDVIGMARLGLRLDLRTAIHKAVRTGELVVHPDIVVEANGETQRINLLVRPLPELGAESGLFLVVFQELGPPKSRGLGTGDASVAAVQANDLVQQLESELRTTKDHLQASVEEVETSNEELKSSNEELLATNEELQSSNEELQTSKEELQSVNEELETINVELQKKVEELDTANSDLENLFQATQIPTLFLDNELRIKRFTAAATELFRLIDSDVGRPITDIAARFSENLIPDMTEVLRTLVPKARQVRIGDGASSYIMRIRSYRRGDNVTEGLVMTFSDVTQLEQALEQRGRLASIVENAHDAILSRTLNGVITSWNDAATRLFGWSEQEALGKSMFDLIIPPDHRGEIEQTEARLARGEHVPPYESVRITKDGRRVAVRVAISTVKDASGNLIGSSGIFSDLTALRRAANIELEGRRKDQFLSTLSHELRGPLATLRICVDLLQKQGLDASRSRDALAMADRQLEHLAALVAQLLDSSRIASGKIALNRVDRNLVDVVRTSAEDQRPTFEAAGVRLDLSLPNTPLWASVDPLRVSQVVVNLLGNAAKFTDRRGLVTLSLRRDDDAKMAVLTVQDDGVGIEPDMLGKLFQPYSQANPLRERVEMHRGLGLGLALVHALVTAHGGTVEARSEGRGRGAEFIVRWPLLETSPDARAEAGRPPATRPGPTPHKILVVEDNWDTAESLRSILQLAGHDVQVAPDGKSALARAVTFHPDLLLCDIGLPGSMDGHAIATTIRSDPVSYGTPYLIALSGYGQPADKARALAAGFDRHVTKAEHPRVLLGLIADMPRAS
jgi:two-component system CheB/CheR fusion protein